jgi:hypothetical protein
MNLLVPRMWPPIVSKTAVTIAGGFLCAVFAMLAQIEGGAISGRVVDATGARIGR